MEYIIFVSALFLLSLGASGTTSELAVTSPAPETTSAPNSTGQGSEFTCWCPCTQEVVTAVTLAGADMDAKVQEIVQNLTVKKSDTSANLRRKSSVPDFRPSATGIGCVGTLVLVFVVVVIVGLDITVLVKHASLVQRKVRRLTRRRGRQGLENQLAGNEVESPKIDTSAF